MRAAAVWTIACNCLAGAVVLAGCAGPGWHAPEAPAHAGYAIQPLPESTASSAVPGGEVQSLVSGGDVRFDWWTQFKCAALDALVEQSFRRNPSVPAAQAALAQAQELIAAQQGYFFPTVQATYQAERHKVSGNTNSSSTIGVQGNGTNLLPAIPETPDALLTKPHNRPSYYTFYTAQLTVGFVPDVFGSNRRQVESLQAQAQVQRFAMEATYITLAANVVAAAVQQASLHAQIQATQDIIRVQEKNLRILQDQLRAGFAKRIDVAAQEAALAVAQATLPPLDKVLAQTEDSLRVLLGDLPDRAAPLFTLGDLSLPPELPLSLPGKIIAQRPDVRAAAAQMHAANANVGVAVAAMLPQFAVNADYGGNATQVTQMFSTGGPFWGLVGNVSQPLFEGGTLWHQKRAASEALKQAAAQYRNTVITAYQNVADALHVLLSDADLLRATVDAEKAAKVALDLTQRQLDSGFVPALTLLTAQAAYDQALLARVQSQARRFGDSVALFEALGGGWWNRTPVAAR